MEERAARLQARIRESCQAGREGSGCGNETGRGLGAAALAECAGGRSGTAAPAVPNRLSFPSEPPHSESPRSPRRPCQALWPPGLFPPTPPLLSRPSALSRLVSYPSGPWGSCSRPLPGTFLPSTSAPGRHSDTRYCEEGDSLPGV